MPLKEFKDVPFITMKPGNDMYKRGAKMCRNSGSTMKTVMMVDQVLTSLNIVYQVGLERRLCVLILYGDAASGGSEAGLL